MPHKDRDARLAYLRAWKARNRPPPVPASQPAPGLPPLGVMTFSADGEQVQCHACGQWLGSLNSHLFLLASPPFPACLHRSFAIRMS